MLSQSYISLQRFLKKPTSIAPLVTLRILLGGLMMVGAIRFWYYGWVERLYVEPRFFFKFYGFEWVEALSQNGMYVLLSIIIVSSAMFMLGLFYRLATIVFFLSFSYLELIDATNYLNHYYLFILLAFLFIFIPAHRQFSVDSWRRPEIKVSHVPNWMLAIIMFQIGLVYTCAGIGFHVMTKLLFNIGLFPFIMIFSTLIFFEAGFHQKLLSLIGYKETNYQLLPKSKINWQPALARFVTVQLLLPFRHLTYSSNNLWSEEGYRFAWRVMLVEKVGQATFHIEDKENNRKTEIVNGRYLTYFQEKQMSIQPDFILQFAHFLKREFQLRHGIKNPVVTVDAHVALNGRSSRRLIDPTVNLAKVRDGFGAKDWVLPFE